jgi:hypothetical protein
MATKKATTSRVPSISADEKRWRAQSDADTLARAEEIKADRSRLTAAQSHASKEAQRFSQVAKQKPITKK